MIVVASKGGTLTIIRGGEKSGNLVYLSRSYKSL